mgnify:FL=1
MTPTPGIWTARLARLVDTALDRSVVLGYPASGHAVRRRLPTWPSDPAPDALVGKHVLVTGASSGLGIQTAVDLALLGAHVHLIVRDPMKAAQVREQLDDVAAGRHTTWRCDLSDQASVRAFAAAYLATGLPVDGLIHNAGILPATRQEDSQGRELTMSVHVLGPGAMTEALLPALDAAQDGARIVFVTSGGMYSQALDLDDLDFRPEPYRGAVAYARSKRAQVELLPILARRWGRHRVLVYAAHPGWAASPGVTSSLPAFARLTAPMLRRGAAGVDTTTWLIATSPAPPTGGLWHDRAERPTSYISRTRASDAERHDLWRWVARNAGVDEADPRP